MKIKAVENKKEDGMNHLSGKEVHRAEIRKFVAAQENAGATKGGELFGGHTINWYRLGDDFLERAGNWFKACVSSEYEKIVQEEFFENLKERVGAAAQNIHSNVLENKKETYGVMLLRNIMKTDIPKAQRYELIIQAAELNPDLKNITAKNQKDWELLSTSKKTLYNEALDFFNEQKNNNLNTIYGTLREGITIKSEGDKILRDLNKDYSKIPVFSQKALEKFKLDYAKKIIIEVIKYSNDPKTILNKLKKIDQLEFTKEEKVELKNFVNQEVKRKIYYDNKHTKPNVLEAILANPRYQKASIDEFEKMLKKEYPQLISQDARNRADDIRANVSDTVSHLLTLVKDSKKLSDDEQVINLAIFDTCKQRMVSYGDKNFREQFFNHYPQYLSISTKEDFQLFKKDLEAAIEEDIKQYLETLAMSNINTIRDRILANVMTAGHDQEFRDKIRALFDQYDITRTRTTVQLITAKSNAITTAEKLITSATIQLSDLIRLKSNLAEKPNPFNTIRNQYLGTEVSSLDDVKNLKMNYAKDIIKQIIEDSKGKKITEILENAINKFDEQTEFTEEEKTELKKYLRSQIF